MVIHAKTKMLEATTLHMAASGGHSRIVKILLENGASPEDENANGMVKSIKNNKKFIFNIRLRYV